MIESTLIGGMQGAGTAAANALVGAGSASGTGAATGVNGAAGVAGGNAGPSDGFREQFEATSSVQGIGASVAQAGGIRPDIPPVAGLPTLRIEAPAPGNGLQEFTTPSSNALGEGHPGSGADAEQASNLANSPATGSVVITDTINPLQAGTPEMRLQANRNAAAAAPEPPATLTGGGEQGNAKGADALFSSAEPRLASEATLGSNPARGVAGATAQPGNVAIPQLAGQPLSAVPAPATPAPAKAGTQGEHPAASESVPVESLADPAGEPVANTRVNANHFGEASPRLGGLANDPAAGSVRTMGGRTAQPIAVASPVLGGFTEPAEARNAVPGTRAEAGVASPVAPLTGYVAPGTASQIAAGPGTAPGQILGPAAGSASTAKLGEQSKVEAALKPLAPKGNGSASPLGNGAPPAPSVQAQGPSVQAKGADASSAGQQALVGSPTGVVPGPLASGAPGQLATGAPGSVAAINSKPGIKVSQRAAKQSQQSLRTASGENAGKHAANAAAVAAPSSAAALAGSMSGGNASGGDGPPANEAVKSAASAAPGGQGQAQAAVTQVAVPGGVNGAPVASAASSPGAADSGTVGKAGAAAGPQAPAEARPAVQGTNGTEISRKAGAGENAAADAKDEPAAGVQRAASDVMQPAHSAGLGSPAPVQGHAPAAAEIKAAGSAAPAHQGMAGVLPEAGNASLEVREHATLLATPNVLEVGIASGTNGWLRVRAEMDGTGEVAATVVANTSHAVESLHKELPALSAYLASESVAVSSLVVNRAEGGAMAQDAAMSFGPGNGAGAQQGGGEARQGGNGDLSGQDGTRSGEAGPRGDLLAQSLGNAGLDFSGAALPARNFGAGSGSWLNVVA